MEIFILMWVIWIFVIYGFIVYNRIISLKNTREQSFADIDVQLKQRFDLLPNLVNTVKWYVKHEDETLTKLTQARTSFLNAWSIDEKIGAENVLSWALKSIFAVAENYPDLKANQNFLSLQTEMSDIENKIASARRFFNSATTEYNTYIQQIPNNIIAWISWFKQEGMFNITNETERENIKVEF